MVFSQTGHEQGENGIFFSETSFLISFSLRYARGLIKVISHLDILFTGGIILRFLQVIMFIKVVTTISSI
jgi:hypothetical protein